ncbi:transcription initiation factor TFIID subunit 9B [Biomphalaria glabrata]
MLVIELKWCFIFKRSNRKLTLHYRNVFISSCDYFTLQLLMYWSLPKPRSVQYGLPVNPRIGVNTQVKTYTGPTLAVVTKTLTQPTVTILNKPQTVPKPTIRVNPGLAGIGASGLSRIISTSNINLSQPSTTTTLTSLTTPSVTPSPSATVTVNPLKRKLDEDDYDNI